METSYRVAGVDVHKKMLAVVITDAAEVGEFRFERRKFGAGAGELEILASWLAAEGVKEAVMGVAGVTDCEVETVWDPPWDQSRMSEEARLQLNMY